MLTLLVQAGIDPRSVISVKVVGNVCTWCRSKCGHIATLKSCGHKLCGNCLDEVVDSCKGCPFDNCGLIINEFEWD